MRTSRNPKVSARSICLAPGCFRWFHEGSGNDGGQADEERGVRHGVRLPMVTADDARWLAGYLRGMVSSRPAAWAGSEMTLAQLIALHFISAKAPVTLIALSEALGTRPPATCAMVDRLARAELVCRTPDPEDLRRVLLALTTKAFGHSP